MMMLRYTKFRFSAIAALCLFAGGCMQSDYTRLVKEELAKGIRQDSVLLGMKLGDTRHEFYGKCFDLNKQEIITDGGNGFVQYVFRDSSGHKDPELMKLRFHANFDNKDRLAEMLMEFSYMSWAPAVPRYHADSLKASTMKLLMQWYGGNQFITAKVDDIELPVKLDGNRRILVYPKDAVSVEVKIQDILHPIFQHSITRDEDQKKGK